MPKDPESGFGRCTPAEALDKPRAVRPAAVPSTAFLRLKQIVGDPKADPPIPPLIPVCKATIWKWTKTGLLEKPVKLGRATAWRVEDVLDLIERLGHREAA